MNELAIRFLWLAGQVTLLSLVAVGLCALAGRRRPGNGAGVALAGLVGLVALTLLALMPLPVWWSWTAALEDRAEAASAGKVVDAENAAASAGSPDGRGNQAATSNDTPLARVDNPHAASLFANLRRIWIRLNPALDGAARHNPLWSCGLVCCLLLGMCFFVARLVVGLHALRRCRARSQELESPIVLGLLGGLCEEMDCRRPVEVREARDIGGPVTIGWRRPVVLLPAQWRSWGDDELRAVLAHEVAHVCRADYAAWLLACLSLALHFYHPLVHWLAGRLHLHQELAADAVGAAHAGGRRAYLRALARLALRQEESLGAGPARAFLPARGTLLKRIAMLRTEEKCPGREWPRLMVCLLLGLLVPAVSAVRGPAQAGDKPEIKKPQEKATAAPALRAVENSTVNLPDGGTVLLGGLKRLNEGGIEVRTPARLAPFVYCACAPDAAGFFAFRPSLYFGADPRMKKIADQADKDLAQLMKTMGGPTSLPKISEIEQLSGCVFVKVDDMKAPKGERGSLLGSLLTVRTTRAYDWRAALDEIAKKVTEVPCAGHTYYKVAVSDFKSRTFFGIVSDSVAREDKAVCFFQPDKRTLAIGSEQQFRDMIRNGPNVKPAWAVAAGWEHVERGVFAVAINNAEQRFAKLWLQASPEEVPADVNAALAKTTALVFGIDYDDELRADLFALCANRDDGVVVAHSVLLWVSKGLTAIQESSQKAPDKVDAGRLLGEKFLGQIRIGLESAAGARMPAIVHARGHANINLLELFGVLSGAKVEAVEVKQK